MQARDRRAYACGSYCASIGGALEAGERVGKLVRKTGSILVVRGSRGLVCAGTVGEGGRSALLSLVAAFRVSTSVFRWASWHRRMPMRTHYRCCLDSIALHEQIPLPRCGYYDGAVAIEVG